MSVRLPDLVGRIRLDTRELDRGKGEVKNFSRSLDDIGKGVGTSLGRGLDTVTSTLTSRLGPAGAEVKKVLDGIGTSALSAGGGAQVGAIAAVGAGLLLTKFATDGVKAFTTLAGEVRAFQRVSGAGAEDASRLVASMKLLGVEPANVGKAFGLLSKNIETNQKKLSDHGIQVARNANGTTNLVGTLFNVSDAFKASNDQATKNTIALSAFGRGGLELVPILARGRDGIKELFAEAEQHGVVFDQEELDNARELGLQMRELKQAFQGLEIQGAKVLVPFLTTAAAAAEKVTNLAIAIERLPGAAKALGQIPGAVAKNLPIIGPVARGLDAVPDGGKAKKATDETKVSVDGLAGSLAGLGTVTEEETAAGKEWAASNKQVADTLDAVAKAEDGRRRAVLSVVEAEGANRRAITSFAAALADVADKERDLADARRERGDAGRDAINVERALNGIEDARSSVVDQERALADARAGRGTKARELVDAERALSKAREESAGAHGVKAQAEAAGGLADAEERLRRAREDGGQAADIADATEALSRAQLDARSAALALAEAKESGADREKAAEGALAASRGSALQAAIAQARTFQDLAELRAEAAGMPLSVSQSYDVFRNKLIEIKDGAVGPLRTSLEGVVNQVAELPSEKKITFSVPGLEEAITMAGRLATTIGGIRSDVDFIAGLSAALPSLKAPSLPALPTLIGVGGRTAADAGLSQPSTSTSTTTINTTVVAPGVNADVAREIDKVTARAAARAR